MDMLLRTQLLGMIQVVWKQGAILWPLDVKEQATGNLLAGDGYTVCCYYVYL